MYNPLVRKIILCLVLLSQVAFAQGTRPNVDAQRTAMKKLAFLVGTWEGGATTTHGEQEIKVKQTEQVTFKLDGLVLLIEGTGRDPATGEAKFRALATVAYDDLAGVYHFRAYNEGNYVDSEMKVVDSGFEWGFKAGPSQITFIMKLDDKGAWVERGFATVATGQRVPFFEMNVHKQK